LEFERVKSKKNGFTLIETLIVLVIIGVMASFTISGFNNIYLNNDEDNLKSLKNFIDYHVDHSIITGESVTINVDEHQLISSVNNKSIKLSNIIDIKFNDKTSGSVIFVDQINLIKNLHVTLTYKEEIHEGIVNLNGLQYAKKK
tara:strand:- start:91 stop:522 length:432 start_codon:yes stop_codon:yes gene_type:complete